MHRPLNTNNSPITPAQHQANRVAHALSIVANPLESAGKPLARRAAWEVLMNARGNRVNQIRLSQMPFETAR